MAKFRVDKKTFKKFIEVTTMEGIIQFRDKKGIKKPLFSSFYVNAKDNHTIEVLTTDSYRKKTDALFILKDVNVEEPGIIPIMDHEAILDCLGSGIDGVITIENNDSILTISTPKDSYEIRQRINKDLEELQSSELVTHLNQWRDWHKFGEDGILVMHHPKVDVPYPMKIKVSSADLLKVAGDTLNIMKDNKTVFSFSSDVLSSKKGEDNASIKSFHEIEHELLGKETIEFEEEFFNVQTIVPNLFDYVEFNIRRVQTNNTVAIYIRSIDEKLKIEVNIGLISIIKQESKGEE